VEQLSGKVDALLAAGQCFTARRWLRKTKETSPRSSRQRAWMQRAEEGCQKSNRYLLFLVFAILGTALLVASGPLTELAAERMEAAKFQRVGPLSAEGQALAFMLTLRTCVATLLLLSLAAGLFRRIRWLFLTLAPLALLAIIPTYDLCDGFRRGGVNAANGLAALALTLVVLGCVWSLAGGMQIVGAVTVLVVGGMTGVCWPELVRNVLWLPVALTAAGWAAILGLSTGWRRLPLFVAAALVFLPLDLESAQTFQQYKAVIACAVLIPAGVLALDQIQFRTVLVVTCMIVGFVFVIPPFDEMVGDNFSSGGAIFGADSTYWLVIWSMILGAIAAQLRDRFSFRLNLLDRMGLVGAFGASAQSTPPRV
jgi:hypothetical protein